MNLKSDNRIGYTGNLIQGPTNVFVVPNQNEKIYPPNNNVQVYPTIARESDGENKSLVQRYPIGAKFGYSLTIIIIAIGQIFAEIFLQKFLSSLSFLQSGWWCGIFLTGFSILALCTSNTHQFLFYSK